MTSVVETVIRRVVGTGVTALATFNRWRMRTPDGPHPFLTGIHAPMTEEVTIEDLAVTGSIPPTLDGCYLRIGPNPIAADSEELPMVPWRRHGPWSSHRARSRALVPQSLGPLDPDHRCPG